MQSSIGQALKMKKIGIISDIHGNLHALEKVLSELNRSSVDEIWCLGDIIGYGAFPSECIEIIKENCSIILGGNHDLAAAGNVVLSDFNYEARVAVEWTVEQLSADELSFLGSLSPVKKIEFEKRSLLLSHGSPVDPVWEYVFSASDVVRALYAMEERCSDICFLGHSHIQFAAYEVGGEVFMERPEKFNAFKFIPAVINPGSVGQPRDYDPRAGYLILSDDGEIEFGKVEYDIDAASAAILDAGLPAFLAARLRVGY
jgi:predicted phosphodiesterase